MKNIAIFYDCENVAAKYVPIIMDYLKGIGKIVSQKAYADFQELNTYPEWKKMHLKYGPIDFTQTDHKQNKNVADMRICAESMAYFYDEKHRGDTVVLVTSDRDFSWASNEMTRAGFSVIGIGTKLQSSGSLTNSFSDFKYLEDLERRVNESILAKVNENPKNEGYITRVDDSYIFIENDDGEVYFADKNRNAETEDGLFPMPEDFRIGVRVRFTIQKPFLEHKREPREQRGVATDLILLNSVKDIEVRKPEIRKSPELNAEDYEFTKKRFGTVIRVKNDYGWIRTATADGGKEEYTFDLKDVRDSEGIFCKVFKGDKVRFVAASAYNNYTKDKGKAESVVLEMRGTLEGETSDSRSNFVGEKRNGEIKKILGDSGAVIDSDGFDYFFYFKDGKTASGAPLSLSNISDFAKVEFRVTKPFNRFGRSYYERNGNADCVLLIG